jgi:hypothetical protein
VTRAAAVLAALLLSGLLAGCQDKGPTTIEVAPGQVIEVSEAPKPSKGIVSGIVGDDAVYPLANATIYILGLGLNTTTDKNGRFAIIDVPPGIYILEGSKKDHATVQTTVDVRAGEVARAVLLLPRVPPTDPYHTTVQQDGYIELWTGYFRISGENTTMDFELDESTPRTLVLESAWEGTFASTSTGAATPFDFRLASNEREVVAGPVPNPFSMHLDARVLPPDRRYYQFAVEPQPDTVVLQASGRLFATVFYNEPAPPQWSLLAGGA